MSEDTLVIIKPDSFWRGLDQEVEKRLASLALQFVATCVLRNGDNLPESKWQEFYFPAIGTKPAILQGTAKYMAFGPVKAIRLRGPDAIQTVRKTIGATRPWQAEKGTIRGDFWPGADEANAVHLTKFQEPGDANFLFNMIHASDSPASFSREVLFFKELQTP